MLQEATVRGARSGVGNFPLHTQVIFVPRAAYRLESGGKLYHR